MYIQQYTNSKMCKTKGFAKRYLKAQRKRGNMDMRSEFVQISVKITNPNKNMQI